jgi:PAS domain S-box-containing protein
LVQRVLSASSIILIGASVGVAMGVGAAAVAPDPASAAFFDDVHWTISTIAGAWLAWLGYFGRADTGDAPTPSDRDARLWFSLGLTSYAIGQILWNVQDLYHWHPFPAPADLFYLAMGPFCAVAFMIALRGRADAGQWRAFVLDAAALSVAVLAIVLALYLPRHGGAGPLQLSVLVAYPFGLLGALCCGIVLALVTRPRAALPWIMMLCSLTIMGLIWMLWNTLALDNAVGSGKGLNALFSVSGLSIGYAAAHWRLDISTSPAYARVTAAIRFLLPMVLVLLASGGILLAALLPDMNAGLRLIIGGASLLVTILAIIRQSFLLKERDDLLHAESSVRRRVARFDQMAAVIEDSIFVTRVEGSEFIYEELNPAALALLGPKAATAVGSNVRDVLPPGPGELALEQYQRCVARGEPVRYEIRFETPDGPHWNDSLLLPIRDNAGRITHIHGVSRNVTRLKAQTEKLERLAADLDRARQDAESASRAKSMFLANMSHELRTPLNAILGFTEVMERQVFGPVGSARYEGYLRDIHSSGQMLLMLVNQVLDLSKLEAGQYQLHEESVDLGEVAAETCAMLEQQAQSKGIMLANIRRPLPRVMADRRAIAQILMNLVANGLKFTPANGSVEVITDRAVDGSAQLMVRDTGMGIPQNEIQAVRQAFVQGSGATRSAEAGTGLGLTIVCSMAELHGGAVIIDSELGKGTTVTVRLPASRMLAA